MSNQDECQRGAPLEEGQEEREEGDKTRGNEGLGRGGERRDKGGDEEILVGCETGSLLGNDVGRGASLKAIELGRAKDNGLKQSRDLLAVADELEAVDAVAKDGGVVGGKGGAEDRGVLLVVAAGGELLAKVDAETHGVAAVAEINLAVVVGVGKEAGEIEEFVGVAVAEGADEVGKLDVARLADSLGKEDLERCLEVLRDRNSRNNSGNPGSALRVLAWITHRRRRRREREEIPEAVSLPHKGTKERKRGNGSGLTHRKIGCDTVHGAAGAGVCPAAHVHGFNTDLWTGATDASRTNGKRG